MILMTQSEEWYLFAVLLIRQRYIWKNKNLFYYPTLYYYEEHDYTCTWLILNILFTSVCNLKISHSVFLWCTVLHVNPGIQVHPQSMTNPSQCIDMPQINLSWKFHQVYIPLRYWIRIFPRPTKGTKINKFLHDTWMMKHKSYHFEVPLSRKW